MELWVRIINYTWADRIHCQGLNTIRAQWAGESEKDYFAPFGMLGGGAKEGEAVRFSYLSYNRQVRYAATATPKK